MKVPLERNSAGCTSPRAVFPLLSYAPLVVIVARLLESPDSQARAATMETLAAARRGSPGSREAPVQMLGMPARPRRRRARPPPAEVLLYRTCRIKSRTNHRIPGRKRALEVIPPVKLVQLRVRLAANI